MFVPEMGPSEFIVKWLKEDGVFIKVKKKKVTLC